jgi:ABC-type multidrug transport system ATPase subunit
VLGPAALELPQGAVVGLVGANGAGKTTLLMALAGLLAHGGGQAELHVAGERVQAAGYVAQQPRLPHWLRVDEVLALYGVQAAVAALQPPPATLQPLLDRRADSLSGGEVQLIAALAALAPDPPVLLLDEPLSSLDIPHRRELSRLIAARRGRPARLTVVSSHVSTELYDLCDWFVVIRGGACVFSGSHADLLRTSADVAPGVGAREHFEEAVVALLTS